jgi:hypothetical protein
MLVRKLMCEDGDDRAKEVIASGIGALVHLAIRLSAIGSLAGTGSWTASSISFS